MRITFYGLRLSSATLTYGSSHAAQSAVLNRLLPESVGSHERWPGSATEFRRFQGYYAVPARCPWTRFINDTAGVILPQIHHTGLRSMSLPAGKRLMNLAHGRRSRQCAVVNAQPDRHSRVAAINGYDMRIGQLKYVTRVDFCILARLSRWDRSLMLT